MPIRWLPMCVATAAVLLTQAVANAQPVADFYRGKTISLYVGFPPGGGYDLYARVFAPHFARHIPGNPQIVIKSMLGGSGIQAAGYMTNVTPQDGTSLGLFLDSLTLGKLLGGHGDFDPVKLTWIGRIVSTATVSVVWHTSPVQTIEEAKRRELLMAGTVPSNTSNFIPAALNDLIGTNHQEWITEKKIRILYTQGAQRIKELPNDPALLDFATDERSRRILGLLGSGPDIGRSLVAEPGIPPERAAALRQAFMATMQDGELIAEIKRRNLTLEPVSGEEIQK